MKKYLILSFILLSNFSISYADNKTDLLNEIGSLETNLINIKNTHTDKLNTKVNSITLELNSFLSGYDSKVIEYLLSLGKITTNIKSDLSNDKSVLEKKLNDELLKNTNSLSNIKNSINITYTTVNETQKTTLQKEIDDIENQILNLSGTLSKEIDDLNNKYVSSIINYKNTVTTAYNSNSGTLNNIKIFDNLFQDLFLLQSDFAKNNEIFKNTYLSFAGDLKNFSDEKQKFYTQELTTELKRIKDKNLEANPSLSIYNADLDRLIDLILENFGNSLKNLIEKKYSNVFSDTDLLAINSKFEIAKNKYYDSNGSLKTDIFLSNSGATDEITFIKTKLNDINSQITALIGTGSIDQITLNNTKIRIENEMVRYWNANYDSYKNDLLGKLQEKINFINQETKTTIAFADNIDIRYSILSDKINKSVDLDFVKKEIDNFKSDTKKYTNLQNEVLNKKINTLYKSLDIYAIKVELNQTKYKFISKTKYTKTLQDFFPKLEAKFPKTYKDKLNKLINTLDNLLESNIKDSKRFMLLNVKLETLNFLNNK